MAKEDKSRFARIFSAKFPTEKIGELKQAYKEISKTLLRQKGLRRAYLVESVDEPGRILSLTLWDSGEVAEAYEKSGAYGANVEKVKALNAEDIKLERFNVLAYAVAPVLRRKKPSAAKKPKKRKAKR